MAANPWDVTDESQDPWSIVGEQESPTLASVNERLRTAALAAGHKAMTHTRSSTQGERASWGDVIAAVPEQVRAGAAGMIAGAQLRELEEMQAAGYDTPTLHQSIADKQAVLQEVETGQRESQVPNASTLQRGVQAGLVSVPTAAPALAAGVLTRNPAIAAAAMYPGTASQAYGQLRTEGVQPESAGRHASFQGLVESGTELLPFAQLLDKLPGAQKLLRTIAAELPTESVAQLLQGGSDYVARAEVEGRELTPELAGEALRSAAERLPETAIATLVASTLQAGGMSLVDRVGAAPTDRAQASPETVDGQPTGFEVVSEAPVGEEKGSRTGGVVDTRPAAPEVVSEAPADGIGSLPLEATSGDLPAAAPWNGSPRAPVPAPAMPGIETQAPTVDGPPLASTPESGFVVIGEEPLTMAMRSPSSPSRPTELASPLPRQGSQAMAAGMAQTGRVAAGGLPGGSAAAGSNHGPATIDPRIPVTSPVPQFRPNVASPLGSEDGMQASRGVQAQAGATYVPLIQATGAPASTANTVTLGLRGQPQRTVLIPPKPIRRENAMAAIERAFGVKIYQGAPFKGRKMLGFFRPKTGEVRIKSHNDLEVAAHEFFHWLDRSFPGMRQLYHRPEFRQQLKGVSYDQSKIFEGFAEFGRLFLTQEAQAAAKAPEFYDAFVTKAEEIGILNKLRRAQDVMHAWYQQGAEGRAFSKIGPPPPSFREWWDKTTRGIVDRNLQSGLDWLHSFKTVERTVKGGIQDATESPYGAARLYAGARGVVKAVLNHGTIAFNEQGDVIFTGPGLASVFEPVADEFDAAMAYFVGRRAQELASQGREHLFSPDEIRALIRVAERSPKFQQIEQAFEDYQAFLERMMGFYIQSGLVSREGAMVMRRMNQDYVPFNRILESLESPGAGRPRGEFKRLMGGSRNLRDIWENIVGSVDVLTSAALKNHAKQLLYKTIESGPKGQLFAVRVEAEERPTLVNPRKILNQLADSLKGDPVAQQTIRQIGDRFAESILHWTGQYKPNAPDIDSVLVAGKPRYFQIGDPLLMETMQLWNSPRPTNLALRILGGFAGTLRRGITAAPDFLIPNLIRDTANAFSLSKGGQIPFVDSLRGMARSMKPNTDVWEFYANGGGFASLLHADAGALKRKLERFYVDRGIDYRTVLDAPQKLLDAFDQIASSFEYGTRIAEYRAMRSKGASRRQSALESRDISTDFAMRGSSELLRYVTTGVAFMNARLQGLYRLQREVAEKGGAVRFNPRQTTRFALRALLALTLPSMLLWWRQHDDPRYKGLPDWIKLTHWVVLAGDKAYLIPKPFEVGAMFATLPEQTLEYIARKDGKEYAEALAFLVAQAFQLDPTPTAVKGLTDLARNKDFSGRPIVPESLQSVAPEEQFTSYTSETAIEIGQKFGISPVKFDHLVRSYFGTLGLYALSTSDALLDPGLGTGSRPSESLADMYVVRRFVRQSPYRGGAFEQDFYQVLEEAREVAATFSKIKRDARMQDAEAYLEKGDNKILYALSGPADRIAARAADLNAAMRQVRLSSSLSADEKREKLDELQAEKNRLFDAAGALRDPKFADSH